MASDGQGLTVRHNRRHEIALACWCQVDSADESSVRLSPKVASTNGQIEATVIDASMGGLGVVSSVFFPKRTRLDVRIPHPVDDSIVALEATMRVQRVAMTDRRPGYLLGLSFVHEDEASSERVDRFLSMLEGSDDA